MSSAEQQPPVDIGGLSDNRPRTPAPDDTAAFQAYYRGAGVPAHGALYRIFVGWWRDRA